MGTKYQLQQQDDRTFTVTTTEEDEHGVAQEGVTESFNSQEEAEAYMSKKSDNTVDSEDIQKQNQTQEAPGVEKAASEMTEADAVALNSDVHAAVSGQGDRIVTDGQKDQVENGLHPDPKEGNPLQEDEKK